VALVMTPSEEFVALVHSLPRLGASCVPLNPAQTAPELAEQLRDCDPALIIHDESVDRAILSRMDESAKGGLRLRSRTVVSVGDLASAAEETDERPFPALDVDLRAVHSIIYTSGSGGVPKGAELSLSNLMWNAVSVGFRLQATATDRWLLCLPLFHIGGYAIIFRALVSGSSIVLHPRFNAKEVSRSLDEEAITLASMVPTMLTEVLEARGGRPFGPRIRAIFLGGGQPPAELLSLAKQRRLPLLLTYGMTETCSQVATSDFRSRSPRPVYRPLPPAEVSVVRTGKGGRTEPASPGAVGEIAGRGPSVFSGYWRKPELTRSRFRDGWFLTGDLGLLEGGSEPPSLVVLGRKEETIVTGGEKVYPDEVEAELRRHPAVQDAVVIGVEDAKWGQKVVAVIEAKPKFKERMPSAPQLRSFLRERLAGYKVPKEYRFVAELPRTASGKARRKAVRILAHGRERAD